MEKKASEISPSRFELTILGGGCVVSVIVEDDTEAMLILRFCWIGAEVLVDIVNLLAALECS